MKTSVSRDLESKIKNIFDGENLVCDLINQDGCIYDKRVLTAGQLIKLLRGQRFDFGCSYTKMAYITTVDAKIRIEMYPDDGIFYLPDFI